MNTSHWRGSIGRLPGCFPVKKVGQTLAVRWEPVEVSSRDAFVKQRAEWQLVAFFHGRAGQASRPSIGASIRVRCRFRIDMAA